LPLVSIKYAFLSCRSSFIGTWKQYLRHEFPCRPYEEMSILRTLFHVKRQRSEPAHHKHFIILLNTSDLFVQRRILVAILAKSHHQNYDVESLQTVKVPTHSPVDLDSLSDCIIGALFADHSPQRQSVVMWSFIRRQLGQHRLDIFFMFTTFGSLTMPVHSWISCLRRVNCSWWNLSSTIKHATIVPSVRHEGRVDVEDITLR